MGDRLTSGLYPRRGDIIDSLRMGRKVPELRERLEMLAIVGMSTEAHFLRSQVGIGSESDCLLGQSNMILYFQILMLA